MSTTTSRRLPGAALAALCVAAGALTTSWLAPATANSARPAAAPATVAVVNIEKVLSSLTELKDLRTVLEQRMAQRQAELDEGVKRLQKIQTELEAMAKDNPKYRDKLAERFELKAQFEARGRALQELLHLEEGDAVRAAYMKVLDAVKRLSEKNGYDLVLLDDRGIELPEQGNAKEMMFGISARRIMHASPSLDVTEQVVSLMNNEYAAGVKRQN